MVVAAVATLLVTTAGVSLLVTTAVTTATVVDVTTVTVMTATAVTARPLVVVTTTATALLLVATVTTVVVTVTPVTTAGSAAPGVTGMTDTTTVAAVGWSGSLTGTIQRVTNHQLQRPILLRPPLFVTTALTAVSVLKELSALEKFKGKCYGVSDQMQKMWTKEAASICLRFSTTPASAGRRVFDSLLRSLFCHSL